MYYSGVFICRNGEVDMFSKILVANRGEIAVRIIRACKEMGINTVAVYSEADRQALHVALADESYCIGKSESKESYLQEERIISAAMISGAQAIHPGYGFLSENAHFAALCRKNGIVFIGPTAEMMDELSDKSVIKKKMEEAGLSVIPGTAAPGSVFLAIAAIEYSIAADSSPYPDSFKSPAPLISPMALMAAAVYPSHCHSIEAPAANAITAAKAYMYHRRPR